jgi:hypothetical protein
MATVEVIGAVRPEGAEAGDRPADWAAPVTVEVPRELIVWSAPLGLGVAAAGSAAEPRAGAGPDRAESVRLAADPVAKAREPTAGRSPLGWATADADAGADAALAALDPAVAPWVSVGPAAWVSVGPAAWTVAAAA